ncbi:DUF349 domain-containing protein [Rheinheimera sp. 1928-s]|uniref:DUF349 domain-containing protein n=1 Tax=Rheinheimera sp. 1928-s TaxID=3033803 RepID=UPI002616424A|nr:DUF349 domain-containing protein [Rheinheimera sp. 1928-s]MDF3127297.1 DUF349 domain-containing protein [Rheinheimera sp. 1928-s]
MMIFKRWFAPKWQHKDAAVRQQAIAGLNVDAQHKEILHELAFNDGHEAVRRAALEKLNEFSLWWQASKQDNAERLKQYAESQLVQMVLENRISAPLKRQFIEECHRSSILEKLALTEVDADIRFSLIMRLKKTELVIANLQQDLLSLEQKHQLLALITDQKQLEKLSKQLAEPLASELKLQLQQLQQAKDKPVQVRKVINLLLAKLNAVRERGDLTQMQQKWQQYQQEWDSAQSELALLDDAAELTQKFNKIKLLTEAVWAPLVKEQQQQQAQQQKLAALKQQQQQLETELQALQQELAQLMSEGRLDETDPLAAKATSLLQQLSQSDLAAAVKTNLQKAITAFERQLQQLPAQAEQLFKLTRLLADWSAATIPTDAAQFQHIEAKYQQWQQEWNKGRKTLGAMLPDSLAEAQQQLNAQWQTVMTGFASQADKNLKSVRSKLAEFRRLYEAGRYKVLFGLFKGIQQSFAELTPAQQQQLTKDYQAAEQQLQQLNELQNYIATPRKQELVAQMQALAEATDVEAPERAEQVKLARATWQTLGRADEAVEQELNQAFNLACEQAFAPCRDYFAAQDEQRKQNAVIKQQILADLTALLDQPLDKGFDSQLTALQKSWRESGPTESALYKELAAQFKTLVDTLKGRVRALHEQNLADKQQLVEKAQQLLTLSVDEAVAGAKKLQQDWKQIGFAGKTDQQLWSQFRLICDQIFANKTAVKQQQDQQWAEQQQQAETQFNEVAAQCAEATTAAELHTAQGALKALDLPIKSALSQQKQQLLAEVQQKLETLEQSAFNASYQQLFDALAQTDVTAEAIPARFREDFAKANESQLTRAQLTTAIELISGKDCVAADKAQVQLQLLSDKHNSGNSLTVDALLKRWLSFGAVKAEEQGLVERLRAVFA